ncbi:hypothetical protein AB0I77_32910 [Streptomyces sp. NPDC050619]|uniref:hypothetical protein n=1 Tax=Streptomyces sp. NPDC050619 TaxID=3157214 RepID=UPI00343714E3
MSESTAQKARAVIERALSGIDEELERHAAGQGRMSSPGQLASIREQLTQMAQQLSAPHLPPKEQRLRGVGRVIADSWPYDNALGGLILEAEQLYLRA